MPDNYVQITASDGWVYVFDLDNRIWGKLCPVDDVPQDVKERMCALFKGMALSLGIKGGDR